MRNCWRCTWLALHKGSALRRPLAGVPGVGPLTAISLALTVDAAQLRSGRPSSAFSACRRSSTRRGARPGSGGSAGGISKAGTTRLRTLPAVGARAVIRHARPGSRQASDWLLGLLARTPRKLAAVALANKMARILWAMMSRGEARRAAPQVQEGHEEKMAFGRAGRGSTPEFRWPSEAVCPFGTRARNPSRPAAAVPRHKAGHTTATAPNARNLPNTPLHQRGRPHTRSTPR